MMRRRLFHVCTVLARLEIFVPSRVRAARHDDETAFDAAPFGIFASSRDGRSHGIRWGKPRKIRKVVVAFDRRSELPDPNSVRLQYWRATWTRTTGFFRRKGIGPFRGADYAADVRAVTEIARYHAAGIVCLLESHPNQ